MGRSNRTHVDIPARPEQELCLANGDGTVSCFDPRHIPARYIRQINENDLITNVNDDKSHEEWIKFILDSCR